MILIGGMRSYIYNGNACYYMYMYMSADRSPYTL